MSHQFTRKHFASAHSAQVWGKVRPMRPEGEPSLLTGASLTIAVVLVFGTIAAVWSM